MEDERRSNKVIIIYLLKVVLGGFIMLGFSIAVIVLWIIDCIKYVARSKNKGRKKEA